jgi:hypothetical protein
MRSSEAVWSGPFPGRIDGHGTYKEVSKMKRLLVVALLALAVPLALSVPASAVPPPTNKNVEIAAANCGGPTLTAVRISHANLNGAVHVVGVGKFKIISVSGIDPVTGQPFTETTNFPKAANATCTVTLSEPGGGTFTLNVTGYLRT